MGERGKDGLRRERKRDRDRGTERLKQSESERAGGKEKGGGGEEDERACAIDIYAYGRMCSQPDDRQLVNEAN